MPNQLTAFCDATILTGDAIVEAHALLVRNGSIVDIVGNRHVPAEARKIPCPGQIVAPGLIDAQVNGGGNVLLNNAPTAAGCIAIAKAHRAYGTTRIVPTCISDTPDVTKRAIAAMREARKTEGGILGIHLEGPHLGLERRGVHSASAIRALTSDDMELYRRQGDETWMMTVAPENVPPETITALRRQGIVVALGHSGATTAAIRAALKAGAAGFTHLYNGMGGKSPAESAIIATALEDRESWCSLIADGHHVPLEALKLALRTKPQGKIFLVSDAMAPAASATPQPFKLYGETIHVEGDRCTTSEGRLAGSAITLLDAARYCVRTAGVELDEALRMASTYPAAFLGLGKKFGKLLPGYTADVIALGSDLKLEGVY